MKLLNFEVTNFGSYKHLAFDFSESGLALVYGATGAGKSTLSDAPCWILYGHTAKGGAVDDIRSWQAGEDPTVGVLTVKLSTGNITVVRIRGGSKNDLYWTEASTPHKLERGKDITETQKRLETRLGVDCDLYLAGAYYHEFSGSGAFFTAKAKDRRELFERLANLDFPTRLAEKISLARKEEKQLIDVTVAALNKARGHLEAVEGTSRSVDEEFEKWNKSQKELMVELKVRADNFQEELKKRFEKVAKDHADFDAATQRELAGLHKEIQDLTAAVYPPDSLSASVNDLKGRLESLPKAACPACGAPSNSNEHQSIQILLTEQNRKIHENGHLTVLLANAQKRYNRVLATINPYENSLSQTSIQENPHEIRLIQEEKRLNPFIAQKIKLETSLAAATEGYEALKTQLSGHTRRLYSLLQLYDLSFDLRGALLKRTVASIEDSTNRNLTAHFDAEIRVSFGIEDSDDLMVKITKDGYECNYKQLSKGQRCLLRLCFAVAVQSAASNRAGVHFDNLFFDESLEGLDAELKTKAFGLLQELANGRESVLVVEHFPEFQQLFSRKYRVELENNLSEIYEEQS